MKLILIIGLLVVILSSGCVETSENTGVKYCDAENECVWDWDCLSEWECVNLKNIPQNQNVAACRAPTEKPDASLCVCSTNTCSDLRENQQKDNCDWRLSDLEVEQLTQPDSGAYYDGDKCVIYSTSNISNIPFDSIEECQQECGQLEVIETQFPSCDKIKNCETNSDCEYIGYTGGCYNSEFVGACATEQAAAGITIGAAKPREGVTCSCENSKCVTYG